MKKQFLSALTFSMFVLMYSMGAAGINLAFISTAQAGGGGGDAAAVEGPAFVELEPLILPIIDNNGVNQTVSLVIALEAHDAAAASEIELMQPKLKDAYIQDMYGMLNKHAALKGGVIQIGMLKKRLSEISLKVMGEDKVDDVLLQVVQQRPI